MELNPDLAEMRRVFGEACDRMTSGKGKERHGGNGVPLRSQPIWWISKNVGMGFCLGQAIKKAVEAPRLLKLYGLEKAKKELLDVIVYAAVGVLLLEDQGGEGKSELELDGDGKNLANAYLERGCWSAEMFDKACSNVDRQGGKTA